MNRREIIFSTIGGLFGISLASSKKTTAHKPISNIKAASCQVPLVEWQSSTGKVIASIDANGNCFFNKQNG